ncbi:hypothetical protein [Streptomyces asoensis]
MTEIEQLWGRAVGPTPWTGFRIRTAATTRASGTPIAARRLVRPYA